MPAPAIPRRAFLKLAAGATTLSVAGCASRSVRRTSAFRLGTFSVDVTVPLGHACMGGGITPAQKILTPLLAKGVVLLGRELPVVLVSVDWCEIRNDAFDRWRTVLAAAAGTAPGRVFVSATHAHDAPVADLEAQRILERHHCSGSICDLKFHEQAVQRAAAAVHASVVSARRITHFGIGQARVEQVASNRRYLLPDGTVSHNRMSATRNVLAQQADEGTIDPWLKTLSFWDGAEPVAALHAYATHPMSYYGRGEVSADFVGLAREQFQREQPGATQIYFSGCSGNVTAGKYNDGNPPNRLVLAARIHDAMLRAWQDTRTEPLRQIAFRSAPLRLEPRDDPVSFSVAGSRTLLGAENKPFAQCLAALNLSWRSRVDAGHRLTVPLVDFGHAQFLLLPGESYVEYQLHAQSLRPDSFVMVAGYGESATGYVPIERAWAERDSNLHDWCWVAPGSEARMNEAIARVVSRR